MNIDILFKPYTGNGCTIELCYKWLCKVLPDCPPMICQQAISEIVHDLEMGKDYLGRCECGCDGSGVHNKINHAMRARAIEIQKDMNRVFLKTIEDRENKRIEEKFKKISNFDKEFIKMNRPPITERSPVLRTIIGLFRSN